MQKPLLSLFGARLLSVAAALTLTSAAMAQATINDCEKIQAADAYNQCLAKFGPTSKLQNLEPGKSSDFKNSGEEAAAGSASKPRAQSKSSRRAGRRGRASHHAGHGGGRKRMVISIGGRRRHR